MLNSLNGRIVKLQLLEMNDEYVKRKLNQHGYNIDTNSFKTLVMKASVNTYGGLKMLEKYSELMNLKSKSNGTI